MMKCKICRNELEMEGEELEGVCDDCRREYYRHSIFGPSLIDV